MKIVAINSVDYGSTGKIMLGIQKVCLENGIDYYCFSGRYNRKAKPKNEKCYLFGSFFDYACSYYLGYLTGFESFFSVIPTFFLLKKIKKINPDIIHMHNLHGSYINYSMLFKFIKKNNIKAVWTLHDCWSFTGRCPYFEITACNKWKDGCGDCPFSAEEYPKAKIDRTRQLWKKKKDAFTNVKNMTLVTPSKWLCDLVGKSFLSSYNCKVIHNGIDLNVFKPTVSDFRQKYHLENKKIILGVSYVWDYRKGFDTFIELSKLIDSSYQIVLVGTNDEVDKILPQNIISIHRTQNQVELAKIYTAADVFVNPTLEDNFPTVNIEAMACGTPVVTFDTGGSAEMIDVNCGYSLKQGNIDELAEKITECINKKTHFDTLTHSAEYDVVSKFNEYISVYKAIG